MNHSPSLQSGVEHRVYWITKRIALGQFATPERARVLYEQGITHVLNVGEAASIVSADAFGFQEIRDCPVIDFARIPDKIALLAIDSLHEMLAAPDSNLFIHCIAGQNRSPTILWLYFIACGLSADESRTLISERAPDAVPGHKRLVDDDLINLAKSHGSKRYLASRDRTILEPAY